MTKQNMKIWDAVSSTDPKHTKHVGQRGGFTAIDAHYQIEMATEQFGPVGQGWGYETLPPIFPTVDVIIVPVVLWHGSRDNVFGPQYGCAKFPSDRIDTDAPKKATTDALTKLLSHLGFNADVFLGKFDDNKYVEEQRTKFEPDTDASKAVKEFIDAIEQCDAHDKLVKLTAKYKDDCEAAKATHGALVQKAYAAYRKRENMLKEPRADQ